MVLKMLRFFHLFDIFKPLKLLLEHVFMRGKVQYEIDNMYALFILFAATMLFAHILACVWIWLGLHFEDGWINSLKAENYDGVWFEYGPYELYVFSLYWIFEVLTTVGYGDFSGSTSKEMLFTIFLEFGGLLLFSTMMALLMQFV